MNASQYNAILYVLAPLGLVLMIAAVVLLVWAICWWRRPARNRLLLYSAISFLGFVGLAAVQYAILFWVFLPSYSRTVLQEREEKSGTLTRVGELAPDFAVSMVDGKELRLSDLRGKVVVLNFFATWCGPCLMELPHLQELWNQHRDDADFAMLVVGREETDEKVRTFRSERSFTFPMASDQHRAAFSQYAIQSIPRTYLIGRDGRVLYQATGFYDRSFDKLQQLATDELHDQR